MGGVLQLFLLVIDLHEFRNTTALRSYVWMMLICPSVSKQTLISIDQVHKKTEETTLCYISTLENVKYE